MDVRSLGRRARNNICGETGRGLEVPAVACLTAADVALRPARIFIATI
jgi:hypothetical protein